MTTDAAAPAAAASAAVEHSVAGVAVTPFLLTTRTWVGERRGGGWLACHDGSFWHSSIVTMAVVMAVVVVVVVAVTHGESFHAATLLRRQPLVPRM